MKYLEETVYNYIFFALEISAEFISVRIVYESITFICVGRYGYYHSMLDGVTTASNFRTSFILEKLIMCRTLNSEINKFENRFLVMMITEYFG